MVATHYKTYKELPIFSFKLVRKLMQGAFKDLFSIAKDHWDNADIKRTQCLTEIGFHN